MAKQEIITLRNGEEIRLSEREKLFSQYYLADGNRNATRAAIKAGLSEKTARITGSKLLTKANIQKYITNHTAPILEALGITQERILAEWAKLAFSNADQEVTKGSGIPVGFDVDHTFKTITIEGVDMDSHEMKVSYKHSAKVKALEALSEHLRITNPQAPEGGQATQNNFFGDINNYINQK
jgi:phage terminase small subunit